MKTTILIFAVVLLLSCKQEDRRGIRLYKADGWGNTEIDIECDSADMLAPNHIVYFVDGRKSNLFIDDIEIVTR